MGPWTLDLSLAVQMNTEKLHRRPHATSSLASSARAAFSAADLPVYQPTFTGDFAA
jgi:hypothetical protein